MEPSLDHFLSHLINHIGASSVSSNTDEHVPWMSVDHPDAFIAAAPKSEDTDVNANPHMANYMFGSGRKFSAMYLGKFVHSVHVYYSVVLALELYQSKLSRCFLNL